MSLKRRSPTLDPLSATGQLQTNGLRTNKYEEPIGPPAKLARRMENLSLDESEAREQNSINSADMEGIEGANFTHLGKQEFMDTLNEVFVDDRFTKIPDFIRNHPPRQPTPPPPQDNADKALILYNNRPQRQPLGADTKRDRRKTRLNSQHRQLEEQNIGASNANKCQIQD